jgi:hypothetical protein
MSLPVSFPQAEICLKLPVGKKLTLESLCEKAGVICRVIGAPAQRLIRLGKSPSIKAVRKPGPFGEIWVGVPAQYPLKKRALHALGMLAFGAFDYGARETLRGLDIAKPNRSRGRPRTGKALSPAERQRRLRERKKLLST